MTTNPSQPAPERPASGPASSAPLDALPARAGGADPAESRPQDRRPAARAAWPAPVAADPPPTTAGRETEEQGRVIAPERAEPAARPAAPVSPPDPQADDHRLAMLGYLGVPFLGPLIPLVIYLAKKRSSPFVRYHAAQAMNLSITALLYTICLLIVAAMLALDSIVLALIVGVTLVAALWLATLAFVIVAASHANRGRRYRIPGWLCASIVH
jgi:uncharacterized Tic20 family protein